MCRALVLVVVWLAALAGVARADTPGPAHSFAFARHGAADLPNHTIIRPADLDEVTFKMPIIVWGNGGCRESNEEFRYFLTHLAGYGYFIVANGNPENPYHPEELAGILDPKPERLIAGMDWAVKQNSDSAGPFYGRLDTDRIVVMGQSCGGWETTDASTDPRVASTVIWDSGTDPNSVQSVTQLHAPVLFAYGGVTDYVNFDAIASYAAVSVPAVLASHADAGHTGMFDDPSPPAKPPGPYQDEPLVLSAQWLAFTLYGSPEGRAFYLGDGCGLCGRSPWTVQSKSWQSFTPAQTEAPPRVCRMRLGGPKHAVVFVDGKRRATIPGRRGVRLRVKAGARVTIKAGRKVVRRQRGCRA
jgi:hypothetical protein